MTHDPYPSRPSAGQRSGPAISVIGLGRMGSRLAGRLIQAGHHVTVWNRTPEKMAPLIDIGALTSDTPGGAVQDADVVITMVSDPAALRDVIVGESGVAANLRQQSLLLEMSTVGPDAITWLRSVLPEGTRLLDAPVLGSTSEAELGTLKIFVGGSTETLDQIHPLLSELGSPIYIGPLGAGASAKLIANAALIGVLGLLGETILLAETLQLPREKVFEVLSTTPLQAQADRRRSSIDHEHYPLRFPLALAHKDARLIEQLANSTDIDLPIIDAAKSWLRGAELSGRGESDYSSVLSHILASSHR